MGSSKFIIYGLVDPRDGQLRYVGKSSSGLRRPRRHLKLAQGEATYKANWIRQLQTGGYQPQIIVLKTAEDAQSLSGLERLIIAEHRAQGCRLTNLTDGGDGCPGRIPSPETKRRIAESLRGRSRPEELRQKLVRATGGRPIYDQHGREYPSIEAAGRAHGLWPQNIRAVLRGRQRSTGGLSFSHNPNLQISAI